MTRQGVVCLKEDMENAEALKDSLAPVFIVENVDLYSKERTSKGESRKQR